MTMTATAKTMTLYQLYCLYMKLTAVSSLNCDVLRPAARLTVVQHLARPSLGPRAMSDA